MTLKEKLHQAGRRVSSSARAVSAGAMLTAATLMPAKSMAQSGDRDVPQTKPATTVVDTNVIKKELGLMYNAGGIIADLGQMLVNDINANEAYLAVGNILEQMQENNKKNLAHNIRVICDFETAFSKYIDTYKLNRDMVVPNSSLIARDFESDFIVGKYKLSQARAGQSDIDTVALKRELDLLEKNKELKNILIEYTDKNTKDLEFCTKIKTFIVHVLGMRAYGDKDETVKAIVRFMRVYNEYSEFLVQKMNLRDKVWDGVKKLKNNHEDVVINMHLLKQARGK